ncbi:MAG: hydratase [Clostridia bacterium]|nr:hydratase [Clostridia bacterium]
MIRVYTNKVYYTNGKLIPREEVSARYPEFTAFETAGEGTIAHKIISKHNISKNPNALCLKFDALASHDITYVGIIQTAKGSGLKEFPIPYVMTNCHNSLCAVGGTINEDDHLFGLSAAKKYGGIYVPANQAVIHSYMREMMAGCGKMILGSDSHTRYGALGTMAIGEGGPELVKQLLGCTYDVKRPDVVAVRLFGKVRKGVGPQDVALAIIGEVFASGAVKNKVLEFIGDGISDLSVEFRNGIDVMTTETACLSSVWCTDEKVKEYLSEYGREDEYKELKPDNFACYDGAIEVDLSKVEPLIALPFHPSNVYKLADLIANPMDILSKAEVECRKVLDEKINFKLSDKIVNGKIQVSQGIIAGCAGGTYDNIVTASNILKNKNVGNGAFSLSVYAGSQPTLLELIKNGSIASLLQSGAVVKQCFCGPCFGAGDVPVNNGLSIRHTTRNFMSREGAKPSDNQISAVALMDARSIAATAANGGILTSAFDFDYDESIPDFHFDASIYKGRIYNGFEASKNNEDLIYGPNIADWPEIAPLANNLAMKVVAVINDDVTTTDELIPSGETSSYRSNPLRLAEFALSRKVPEYVSRAKAVKNDAIEMLNGNEIENVEEKLSLAGVDTSDLTYGSVIFAKRPGDGSAREQAASCQRVLGGVANIANEYATKRYRSNLINWGMLPFLIKDVEFKLNDIIVIKDIRNSIKSGETSFEALLVRGGKVQGITLSMDAITDAEKQIILKGSLMNYYANLDKDFN